MANQSSRKGFPEFFADAESSETLRHQFIERPKEAARQSAFSTAIDLLSFMSILPDAFIASQRRELNRILRSGDERDLRVTALQTSIEQADVLRSMARKGEARIQRVLTVLAHGADFFHGFVSDRDLAPLTGLTVRLRGRKIAGTKRFSATTDADGYFSIALGGGSRKEADASKRFADLLAGLTHQASAATSERSEERRSQVEIVKGTKVLHRDPIPVTIDQGSVYREYVIDDTQDPFV
jgi:hypothetical protein